MHKYLCALHSIGLFRSGSLPHTFSLSCLPPTITYSSFSCALVVCMITRSFFSISYPSPFRTARAAKFASFFLAALLDSRFAIKLIALIEINHRKYNTIRDMCLKFDFRDYNNNITIWLNSWYRNFLALSQSVRKFSILSRIFYYLTNGIFSFRTTRKFNFLRVYNIFRMNFKAFTVRTHLYIITTSIS